MERKRSSAYILGAILLHVIVYNVHKLWDDGTGSQENIDLMSDVFLSGHSLQYVVYIAIIHYLATGKGKALIGGWLGFAIADFVDQTLFANQLPAFTEYIFFVIFLFGIVLKNRIFTTN